MRRFTALLLVASLSLQAPGCATSFPAQPPVAATRDASQAARAESVVVVETDPRTGRADAVVAHPPAPSASEFWSGPVGGLIVGVGLVAVIAAGILIAGKTSDGAGSTGGTGTGGTGTGGTGTGTPSVTIQ